MSAQVIETKLDDNTLVFIEGIDQHGLTKPALTRGLPGAERINTEAMMNKVFKTVQAVGNAAKQTLEETGAKKASIEIGLSVGGEGDIWVVKGKIEANIIVTLEWVR